MAMMGVPDPYPLEHDFGKPNEFHVNSFGSILHCNITQDCAAYIASEISFAEITSVVRTNNELIEISGYQRYHVSQEIRRYYTVEFIRGLVEEYDKRKFFRMDKELRMVDITGVSSLTVNANIATTTTTTTTGNITLETKATPLKEEDLAKGKYRKLYQHRLAKNGGKLSL